MDKVSVEIELPIDVIHTLMFMAHERDITLNQFIQNILLEYIEEDKQNDSNL
jgi:hypothetical protein